MTEDQLAAEFTPLASIEVDSDGGFELAADPSPFAVWAKCAPIYDRFGGLIDVVGWPLRERRRWWLRRRSATHAGDDALARAEWYDRPVHLVETPQDWFSARGSVVAILDWSVDPRSILAGVPEVICSTPPLQRRLEASIAEHSRPPFAIRCAT